MEANLYPRASEMVCKTLTQSQVWACSSLQYPLPGKSNILDSIPSTETKEEKILLIILSLILK